MSEVTIEISRRGLSIESVGQLMPQLKSDLVEFLADDGLVIMQQEAPRGKTDKLWRSIHKTVGPDGATVKPEVDYAIYVEKGTRPHMIFPVRARALRFEIGGKIIFSAYVKHPGTQPNPFMARTATAVRRNIPMRWREVWDRAVKTEA